MSPDGSAKQPPEEKLLKLIRGKGPRADAPSPLPAHAGGGTSAMTASSGGMAGRARTTPWPRIAIGCLGAALFIEVVGLLVEVMRPLPAIHVPAAPTPPVAPSGTAASTALEIPSLEASLSRPVFTPIASEHPAPRPSAAKPGLSGSAKQLASRLSLMGIVSGPPGEAVIEDSETKKTYFVTTGQSVVDGATLERVLDHRVILDLDGEKIELTL